MIENPLTNSPPDVALPRGGRLRQVQQSALTVWKEQLSYRLELSLSLLCIQKILEILCRKLALWRCIVVLPEAALSQGWDEEVMLSLLSFAWYHQASVVLQDPQVGTLRTCWGSIRNRRVGMNGSQNMCTRVRHHQHREPSVDFMKTAEN